MSRDDRTRNALAAAALVGFGCSGGGAQPPAPAPPPSSSPVAPPVAPPAAAAAPRLRPLCGHPDEARLRATYPGLPQCSGRQSLTVVEATVRGRLLFVAGWGHDPCCTDVPSPTTAPGALVFIDGRELPRVERFGPALGDLTGVDEATAGLLLQALLLEVGAVDQIVSAEEVAALVARWPAAGPPVAKRPPGLVRDGGGFRLWVWTESSYAERGIDCHYLDGWAATLSERGELAILIGPGFADPERHARYSQGRVRGGPCDGEPL